MLEWGEAQPATRDAWQRLATARVNALAASSPAAFGRP
jgi:hypothetical protein